MNNNNIPTKRKVLDLLLEEYPIFSGSDLVVEKQYKASNNRVYNTFLISSSKIGFEKFVAKGVYYEVNKLELEWIALNLLQKKKSDSPKLLFPKHKPDDFLLLEFIEGKTATEVVIDPENRNKLFEEIGSALGKLHTTKVGNFGSLIDKSKITWKEYVDAKLFERLHGVAALISKELYKDSENLFISLKNVLESESKMPVLIHRDIYLDNFIVRKNSGHAILIDYGMALGGRPFYDLAKFYIWELSRYPEQKDIFLNAYQKYVFLSDNFKDMMRIYTLNELLGMIGFANNQKNKERMNNSIKVLDELVKNVGIISQLLN